MTIEHGEPGTDEAGEPGEPGEPGAGGRPVDLHVERIVAVYLVLAVAWIAVTSVVAELVVEHTPLPLAAVELTKGLVFVVATGLILRAVLRRWADRVVAAAESERRAAARLREAEQLRSRFLRGISHELRTPLTNIIGYGLTINTRLRDLHPDQLEAFTGRLVVNARRLQRLVLDLLDVDRLTRDDASLHAEQVRIDRLVARVLDTVADAGHHIHVEVDAISATVDRSKTERIVEELVRNATRHTPDGTRVWVRATRTDHLLHLVVEDEGSGVEASVRDRVLEPFVQGAGAEHAASPGLGIGLALVAGYARVQGGDVHVDERSGGGARFVVTLPLTPC